MRTTGHVYELERRALGSFFFGGGGGSLATFVICRYAPGPIVSDIQYDLNEDKVQKVTKARIEMLSHVVPRRLCTTT